MTLGERIKRAREAKGLTLLDVAKEVGVSEATLQRYESGNIKNPKQPKLLSLAKALDVDVNYLMNWKGDDEKKPKTNIDYDLEDLVIIYNKLGRKERHELMAKAYQLEKEMKDEGRRQ